MMNLINSLSFLYSLPSLLVGLMIFLVSILIAWVLKFILSRIVKPLLKRTQTDLDDNIYKYFSRGLFWSILFIGLYIGLPFIDDSLNSEFYEKPIYTLAIFVWSWIFSQIAIVFFEDLIERQKNQDNVSRQGIFSFLKGVSIFFIGILAVMAVFIIWNINITPVLASAGVAGVAVGFAAKDTVSNFFGGISIFFDQPFKVGDYVIIRDKYRGEVIKIGTRSTKIRTRDNILLTIPNSVMVTDVVVNETGYDNKLRIRIPIGVSYKADLEKVEKVLEEVIESNLDLVQKANNTVFYREFGPSTVKLEVFAILNKPVKKGFVIHKLIKSIYQRFAEEGINMPAPQREVKLIKN
jgi:small-conductance mechanosensitive channel